MIQQSDHSTRIFWNKLFMFSTTTTTTVLDWPQDVKANVSFQVNVWMVYHCITFHFWRFMWVALTNFEAEHKSTASVETLKTRTQVVIPNKRTTRILNCTIVTDVAFSNHTIVCHNVIRQCCKLRFRPNDHWPCWDQSPNNNRSLTSSGEMISLKFKRSSGSGKSTWHVFGKLSSLMSENTKRQFSQWFHKVCDCFPSKNVQMVNELEWTCLWTTPRIWSVTSCGTLRHENIITQN